MLCQPNVFQKCYSNLKPTCNKFRFLKSHRISTVCHKNPKNLHKNRKICEKQAKSSPKAWPSTVWRLNGQRPKQDVPKLVRHFSGLRLLEIAARRELPVNLPNALAPLHPQWNATILHKCRVQLTTSSWLGAKCPAVFSQVGN